MSNFIIEDVEIKKVAGFVLVSGKICMPENLIKKKNYSYHPFTVYVKVKRIGSNDFYYTKANLNNCVENVSSLFDAALQLSSYDKNHKIWVDVISEQYSIGTKSEEFNLSVY